MGKGRERKGGSRTEGEEEHGNGTWDEDGRGGWWMLGMMLLGGGEGGWSGDEGPLRMIDSFGGVFLGGGGGRLILPSAEGG